MKLKIFTTSLTLFLVIYFGSLFYISQYILKNQLEQGKEQALAEHYYLAESFAKDITSLAARQDGDPAIISLLSYYGRYYREQGLLLDIYTEDSLLIQNIPGELAMAEPILPEPGYREFGIEQVGGAHYVRVTGDIPATGHSYFLQLLFDISPQITVWQQIVRMMMVTGATACLLLALMLLLLLNKIFQPMQALTVTARQIASGQYEKRLPQSGHNEAAEMAESFNRMAEKIQQDFSELTSLSQSRQQFIDNLAHEMRTPVTAIYGNAEYLLAAPANEDERIEAAQQIMQESNRLLNLAEKLLTLAGLRQQGLVKMEISVDRLFQQVLDSIRFQAQEKEINIRTKMEIELLYGDFELLKSLLLNLLQNAIHASAPRTEIQLVALMEDGNRVLCVTDQGPGIPQQELRRIIEPFYRLDKGRSRKTGGSGLGLALCSQIATCHNASLQFTSSDRGTTVCVIFTGWQ